MKFTLKDYQNDAVREVLDRLRKARKRWHEDRDKHAFSLAAPTGAGKTVCSAAVFEALFHGDDDFNFDADPGAVVIWFSDDPSLNEQTRFRLMESSDRLRHTDLVPVENTFSRETFEAGKVYFLNTQKLAARSLLVRGFEPAGGGQVDYAGPPDGRSHTIWDTIRNTIEDPALTLYLVLDEAHRGMSAPSRSEQASRSTIVQRLINGAGGVPAIPVVLGISATVERFNEAMKEQQGRTMLPNVVVDTAKVQESGLLKDTIVLDIPDDDGGAFENVLVRRAADKLKEADSAWKAYAQEQGLPEPVVPLMVLQVPNTPDPANIGRWLDTIFQQWPELPADSVANVFGEHKTETFGSRKVPYIEPQSVQDQKWVRILVAKDAISTGWDCPRAEVMVSFRSAQDKTHITQLLGRMVRTPLARRIPGNDRLNAVDCLLPFFNKAAVESVANALMTGGEAGDLPIKRVITSAAEMRPNPAVPKSVWEKFQCLPSQSRPQKEAKPAKRLTALAHELASDGLLEDAGKKAHAEMHKVLNAAQVRYATDVAHRRKAVMEVEGNSLTVDLAQKKKSFDQFLEDADIAVIDDAFKRAARIFSPDIARTYVPVLAANKGDPPEEEDYLDARADVAALGLVPEVADYFDAEARKLADAWFRDYRVEIKNLPHERQEAYRQIKEMSKEPQDIELAVPTSWMEATAVREGDRETPVPRYQDHLMCDSDGTYPTLLNDWEREVLSKETSRNGFKAWYRNPNRASQESLGIAYDDGAEVKIVRPDFLFFGELPDGTIAVDLVDPHGTHLADALPKLKGMAKYAETHSGIYRRVESIAAVEGEMRVLDLKDMKVRQSVLGASDAASLFGSALAHDYK